MWEFVNKPEEVISAIKNAADWNKDAINYSTYR